MDEDFKKATEVHLTKLDSHFGRLEGKMRDIKDLIFDLSEQIKSRIAIEEQRSTLSSNKSPLLPTPSPHSFDKAITVQPKVLQLDFPHFDGEYPTGWIY